MASCQGQMILSLCAVVLPTAEWGYECSSNFSEIFEVYELFGLLLTVDNVEWERLAAEMESFWDYQDKENTSK